MSREPEFSRHDVNLLLALAQVEAGIGQYGEVIAEAMSPDADPASNDAKYRFVAVGPRVNYAEAAVQRAQAEYDKKYKDSPRYGHKWAVRKELTAQQEPDGSDG